MRARSPGMALMLLTAALVASCSTTMTGRRQLTLVPEDQMAAMGEATFESVKEQARVSNDTELQGYVECIARPLIRAIADGASSDPGAWEVLVFEEPTPNAFALPGAKIGVHTGMLTVATTDAQLASVVGHEIAHVLLQHGNERVSQSMVAEGLFQTGVIAAGGMSPEVQQMVVSGLGIGAQYGVLLPFSRKHESEADILGQRLMADAGFDPEGAVEVWQRMARVNSGQQPPEFASTHPAYDTRIGDLQDNLSYAEELYRRAKRRGREPQCSRP